MHYSTSDPNIAHSLRYLRPGEVSPEHFMCLMILSKTHGKKIQPALEAFLVKGITRKEIFDSYNVSAGYFSLKLGQIRQCSRVILKALPFYINAGIEGCQNDKIGM
ncbi:Major pilu subunit operon regulatory protein papB [Citrobacter freundii]|nr:Major pilu subunit operon regulatory protein papB [Citrobacter freundii]